ncbi:TetR family transcriptional regulator [Trinickia sp. YCB016]
MKRSPQDALLTRAKILNSAARIFLRRGLSRASLEEIAGVAGVTRGAVYGHFRNKSALFDALLEETALPADPFLIEWSRGPRDPLDHLKSELMRLLAQALSKGAARRLYSVIYSRCEITRETRHIWSRVREERKLAERRIANALREAHADGLLRDGIDAEVMAAYIHSCLMGFFFRSLGEPVSPAPGQVAGRVVALVLLGVVPSRASVSHDVTLCDVVCG